MFGDFSLEGKVALITGGSGGIGSAITKLFLNKGAKVIATGTNSEKLEKVCTEINHLNLRTLVCNLADTEETNALFGKAEELFGQVDILVNNAGITKDKLVFMMRDEDFDNVINVNLGATFKLSRSALKSMMKRQSGRIINVTSIIGVTGNVGQANYAASKAGIIGMSKSMALESASKGVTINCVAPGFIDTPMTEKLSDKIKDSIMTKIPQQKMGTPEEIAACCLFLASDESQYLTGQTLHPNGGMIMV